MTVNELWQDLIALIPVAGFAAAVVASVVYVRYKGTIDAMRATVDTYEKLAEGRKEESEALRQEIADLEKKVQGLEQEMRGQAIAFEKLTEKFVDSLKYGACIYSESCDNFRSPSRGNVK